MYNVNLRSTCAAITKLLIYIEIHLASLFHKLIQYGYLFTQFTFGYLDHGNDHKQQKAYIERLMETLFTFKYYSN